MTTRRDMTGIQFQRALQNQEFKADFGSPWYCSTREGTDKTIAYGTFVTGGAGRSYRRETIRNLCVARTRHEKKRKNKGHMCPLCNDTGRAQTYRREGDTNQIAGFAKCVCREPKPTKKGGQQMREISRGKWRHVREDGPEGGGVAYIMADNVRIATMSRTYDGRDNETREREAFGNGEVMAASGALLVACRAMRQSLIEAHDCRKGPRPKCLVYADAAIAQAEERHEWPKV